MKSRASCGKIGSPQRVVLRQQGKGQEPFLPDEPKDFVRKISVDGLGFEIIKLETNSSTSDKVVVVAIIFWLELVEKFLALGYKNKVPPNG